jgi:hypothetical protein
LLDISIIIILVFLGFKVKYLIKSSLDKKDKLVLNGLWLYHLLICVFFYYYLLINGGDAINYWETVKNVPNTDILDYFSLGFGTYFMYVLNYFPSKILDLSLFTGSVIYAFVGFVGFVYFYFLFKERIKYNKKIFGINFFPLIFFLPNLHFWTVGIGKDSLMFLCIGIIFYCVKDIRKYIFLILLSLILIYFTRPHIAAFIIIAFGIGFILDGELKIYLKFFFTVLIIWAFVIFYDPVMEYLRIEDFNLNTISDYSSDKVGKLSRGHTESSVDISNSNLLVKIFTFMYRPFFFDMSGFLAVLASLENLVLLFLTIRLIILNPIKLFFTGDFFYKSLNIFLIIGVISFSLILGNLGIMLRQKNMFIPSLLFICLWAFSYETKKRLTKNKKSRIKEKFASLDENIAGNK